MELLGGVLGNDALAQCELLAASESSRVLMADVARALREGRAEAVPRQDSAAFEAMSEELRGVLVALTDPSPRENECAITTPVFRHSRDDHITANQGLA